METEITVADDPGLMPFLEYMRDAVAVVDAQTRRIVRWNAAAGALLGYTPEEAGTLRLEDLLPEGIEASLRADLEQYAETGTLSTVMLECVLTVMGRHKQRGLFALGMRLSPLSQTVDDRRVMLVMLHEPTQHERVETALLASEDNVRFQSAFTYAAIGARLEANKVEPGASRSAGSRRGGCDADAAPDCRETPDPDPEGGRYAAVGMGRCRTYPAGVDESAFERQQVHS